MRKEMLTIALAMYAGLGVSAAKDVDVDPQLVFDASKGEQRVMAMPDGSKVEYTAHEGMFYVTNVEDSTYQTINVYVPNTATQQSPIFLRTYVGGYMASAAKQPSASDASGRALQEGYVVAIPGSRGRNSTILAAKNDKATGVKKGQTVYTGRAPKAILDLKAAIRYLRHFDQVMMGDAEHIITDGTSAGGAMSSLMGATGNNPAYEPLLESMGAAKERDDVFASVCYCPIIDLEHADMAYEWLYNGTESRQQGDAKVLAVSNELKTQFPDYLNSLNLKTENGTVLTADNYLDFIKRELIRSAQLAKNAGADIPDSIGFSFNQQDMGNMAPVNGGMTGGMGRPMGMDRPTGMKMPEGEKPAMGGAMAEGMKMPGGQMPQMVRRGGMGANRVGEYITDLDMDKYLNYVVSTQPLKTAPAFDTQGVVDQKASGENELFGDRNGSSVNFTEYGCQKNGTSLSDEVRENARLLNPMYFVGDSKTDVAPHWYIRHGSRDRDTAFPVPLNFALKLQNEGKDVNFLLAWNRPHGGDYALDELFQWIRQIMASEK
ncbi:MAG: alpha/beta hydrolase [Bacteroidaceae bacterium]|nr:alpha/beta hydrolase [Bacteroidaceae bacterium]